MKVIIGYYDSLLVNMKLVIINNVKFKLLRLIIFIFELRVLRVLNDYYFWILGRVKKLEI